MRSTTQPPGDITSQPVLLPARRSGCVLRKELGVVEQPLVVLDLDPGLLGERLEARVAASRPRRCRCRRGQLSQASLCSRSAARRAGGQQSGKRQQRTNRQAAPPGAAHEGPTGDQVTPHDAGQCRARSDCGAPGHSSVSPSLDVCGSPATCSAGPLITNVCCGFQVSRTRWPSASTSPAPLVSMFWA